MFCYFLKQKKSVLLCLFNTKVTYQCFFLLLVLMVGIDRMKIAGCVSCHKVSRDLFTASRVFCYSEWKLQDNSVALC